jgi:membrane protease YdiL (CAAX protease family)
MKRHLSLCKWIATISFGFLFFLFLSQFLPAVGTLSNNAYLKSALLLSASILAALLYILYVRVAERRKATELSLKRIKDLFIGFAIGIIFIALVVGVLYLLGVYKVYDISLPYDIMLMELAGGSIVAVTEEIIFRGVMYRMIEERFRVATALVVTSLLFGMFHLWMVDIWCALAIAAEAGIMLAAAYKINNNLWLPIGIHWSWNYALGPIFGWNTSGILREGSSIFTSLSEGPKFLTGATNGLEGSVVTLIIGTCLGVVLWFYATRKSKLSVELQKLNN